MDLADARRLKELEKENTELKTILAESLLKNRVLEAVNKKKFGSDLKSATPFDTRELHSFKMVEAAVIEPEGTRSKHNAEPAQQPMPNDLARVVAAWPSLSDDQKAQILAIVGGRIA